jgi:APA family basic amino acid/polyamine antiporter
MKNIKGALEPPGLRRQLGSPALFGIVQGFIAASIYFSVGLVAERALGFTWVVFLAGAVLFAVIVPCYVEGASLHQERGGATVIARYAFNELVSFIAGWAICLDYLILVALCAFATTDYLGTFWHEFDSGFVEFGAAALVVLYVALVAMRGPGPRRFERVAVVVVADLLIQVTMVAIGLALLFEPDVLTHPASIAGSPRLEDVVFAFPLVLVAFSGIDASSGLAGQVAIGRRACGG